MAYPDSNATTRVHKNGILALLVSSIRNPTKAEKGALIACINRRSMGSWLLITAGSRSHSLLDVESVLEFTSGPLTPRAILFPLCGATFTVPQSISAELKSK